MRVVLFECRLPSITHEAFVQHYETEHIPLIKTLEAHFERFTAIMFNEEKKRIREDSERRFLDMDRMTGLWQLQEHITWGAGMTSCS